MPKVNAYSLFVYDVARRRKAAGETNVIVPNLFKELGSEWSSMPDEQKQRYKDRAKSSNPYSSCEQWTRSKETPVENLASMSSTSTADGVTVKIEVDKKPDIKPNIKPNNNKRPHDGAHSEQEKKKPRPGIPNWKNIKKTSNIVNPIKYLDQPLKDIYHQCQSILRARSDKLVTIPIYSFSVNVLCKHKKDAVDIFVPLEICICAYSVKTGSIGQPYHVMIDAGPVPTNCLNIALDHSVNHKITFPPNSNGYPGGARNDYRKIYKEMLNYTEAGERTILVEGARFLPQVRCSLEWIYNKAMEEPGLRLPQVSTWTILPVTDFVACMYNCVYQNMLKNPHPFFGLHYYINMLLEASTNDYNTAIMCKYHEKDETVTKFCAQSCARKMLINIENVFCDICHLYEIYRNSQQEPVVNQPYIQMPAPIFGQDPQASLPSTSQASHGEQPFVIDQPHQPILAIQAATAQDIDTSLSLDPRMRGRLQSNVSSSTSLDATMAETTTANDSNVAHKKTSKPREDEPLIISSSEGVIYEFPTDRPDVY